MSSRGSITVAAYATDELTEKRSRFIGHIAPVQDEKEAMAFVAQVRAGAKDASHHCYAWQAGDNDCYQRSSDDGEPSGTAGRPILEVIKRSELHDTVIVVTRYFGGILLGAGGLTRAYSKAAALAVAAAELVCLTPARRFALYFDYALLGRAEKLLPGLGCRIEDRSFGQQVCFICIAEPERLPLVDQTMADISGGAARRQELGEAVLRQPAY